MQLTTRKLLLLLFYAIPPRYTGMYRYRIPKHFTRQIHALGMNDSYLVDTHRLFDFVENLKDLQLIAITKTKNDIDAIVQLTKYGEVLAKHILQNDLGYVDRTIIVKQFE